MDRVRWGILSTANIGVAKVIPAMQAAERTEIAAIASRDLDRATAAAEQLGIRRSFGSYEALLEDPHIDAIYNPLPNHLHARWTIAALEAGKHVLCEKPIGMTSHEAREMAAAAERTGRTLMEAFMYRLHPSWVAVRDLVASGAIGDLVTVQSWFSYFNDDPSNIRNIAEYGGGGLMDIGCYNVNLSRMLFGAEPTGVSATMAHSEAFGVDTLTSAILEFPNGTATFTCSTLAAPDQRVHIVGTSGRISFQVPFNIPPERAVEVYVWTERPAVGVPPDAPPDEIMSFGPADQYTLQAEAFAAAVLDGAPPHVSLEDSIANMEVIEAVVAAAS